MPSNAFISRALICLMTTAWMLGVFTEVTHAQPVKLYENSKPRVNIFANPAGEQGNNAQVILNAAAHLNQQLARNGQPSPAVVQTFAQANQIVLARADQYPDIAALANLDPQNIDAYAIVPHKQNLYILGNTAQGVSHGTWSLLHHLGFRYYAPSPAWHVTPTLHDVSIDKPMTSSPYLRGRNIWYAYGMGSDKNLAEQYKTWAIANRLPSAAPFHTGHSYGNIISRNKAAFDKHPEYFALLEDGSRDSKRAPNARKFCVSNPGLINLVIQDRIKLLEEQKANNPQEFMVSVDPSDGQGSCLCENCAKIGTTTDRVVHLANHVAKALREKHPDAWVGMYAYSSHRLPPTIDVEPNVYVQVAMGFNRTQYSLPQLVSKWAEKTSAIGLREYYGVEAWDWGLPGRMRGAQVDYHARWIPYYAQRKLNAINAETNANWAGQTPGLYIAARLMWNPEEDVQQLTGDFYKHAYGSAEKTMRHVHELFDTAPMLKPFAITPMLDGIQKAYEETKDDSPQVRARIIDMMAYMHYIHLFMNFQDAKARDPKNGDIYYDALKPLMEYAWRIRSRDIVHYYALARRLTNGLPLTHGRFEFWYALNGRKSISERHIKNHPNFNIETLPDKPVWMTGEQLTDDQVIGLFNQSLAQLSKENDALRSFDGPLHKVFIPGDQAGASQVFLNEQPGLSRFRNGLNAVIVAGKPGKITLMLAPDSRQSEVKLFSPDGKLLREETLFKFSAAANADDETDDANPAQEAKDIEAPLSPLELDLPASGVYRLRISNSFRIVVPADVAMAFEASPAQPVSAEYSGNHFFYVPNDTTKLRFDMDIRLSILFPDGKRKDFNADDRVPSKSYVEIDVPREWRGKVWQTHSQTRGTYYFLNIPTWLSIHRNQMVLPEEAIKADSLKAIN